MKVSALTTDDEQAALNAVPRPVEVVKDSIDRFARARWALPTVVLLAVLAMVVNEATYQHTRAVLTRGIALTDARIEAARTLQALTELEAAGRAFVASRDAADRERFEQAARTLPLIEEKALALVKKVDPAGAIAVARVRELIDDRLVRWRGWLTETGVGAGRSVGSDGADSRVRWAELAGEFEQVLAKAEGLQQHARLSLYEASQLSRGAVHLLILLSLFALVQFGRQLRRADAQQAREKERLATQIRDRTAELRDLAGHLVSAREDERSRVARELHDELGGQLTAMKLELARLRRVPDLPPTAAERLSAFDKRLNEGIALKRRIIENLRPSSLDQLGLNTALELLCADTSAVSGVAVHAHLEPVAVEKEAELCLFRVVQESLTNAMKHAEATQIDVTLARGPSTAELTVRDNGKGFEPNAVGAGRHGILGMRLRLEIVGGSLAVDSVSGQGTRVVASVPLAET